MYFRVIIVLSCIYVCQSARILGIFPTPSISHQIVFRAITQDLASRGHHIVVLTTDPVNSKDPAYMNISEIDVHDVSYDLFQQKMNMAGMRAGSNTRKVFMPVLYNLLCEIFEEQMKHPQIQNILNDPDEHFDLLLIEFLVPSAFGFLHRFKAPTITLASLPGTVDIWESTGNPSHPLLYYDVLSSFVGKMNFFERLDTALADLWYRHYFYTDVIEMFDDQSKRIFGKDTPHLSTLENSVDMVFFNVYLLLCGIRPLTPSTILLGGMHITPKKPLGKDIQEYLDKSTNGVVYFSLGSNVKSNQLPAERRQTILEALGELPYNVMWKYEDDNLPGKPENVLISKWFPQYDMLGHPNIKAFVFQGGQQSLEEAVLSAVPLVGIPFIGDQDKNVKTIVDKEIGVFLEIGTLTKESLKEAILEVINNKKYKENIEKLSKIIDDDPMTSRERAVWWIEYVLRHKGAKHLRSPIMDMPLYQYFMLDIFGFIITIILVIIYIITKIFRHFFPKKKNEKLKKT